MKNLLFIIGLLALFVVAPGWADASVVIESGKGQILLEAQETPLGEVLENIRSKFGVEISGLEGRNDEPVTFSFKEETLEDLLKRLFRYLGETNYAFEFENGKIRRVTILPKSEISDEVPSRVIDRADRDEEEDEQVQKILSPVVRVKGVMKGTKAYDLGLVEGDLIISYAGVRVNSTRRLVGETKKKINHEVVEMIVVRDQRPIKFYLERGYIGVRIHTVKIPREELDTYYASQ
jgi:hypothetical protein